MAKQSKEATPKPEAPKPWRGSITLSRCAGAFVENRAVPGESKGETVSRLLECLEVTENTLELVAEVRR